MSDVTIILTSEIFRDNERLQRAASDHRHHVLLGDEGEHVRRIQMFLMWYFDAAARLAEAEDVDEALFFEQFQTETLGSLYGPRTADLVRDYKRMHEIIDRTRQTQADGIVGVRTIRDFDRLARNHHWRTTSIEDRMTVARQAPHALKTLVMAGPTVGARMLATRR